MGLPSIPVSLLVDVVPYVPDSSLSCQTGSYTGGVGHHTVNTRFTVGDVPGVNLRHVSDPECGNLTFWSKDTRLANDFVHICQNEQF